MLMYTMMEVCREADMTYQTLKFYCNEGLAGRREYVNDLLPPKEA